MPSIQPIGPQQFRISNNWGLLLRLIGLPFVGFGLWVGVWPTAANVFDWVSGSLPTPFLLECIPGMLIGTVIGIPLLCVGWAMTFLRHNIVIDQREKQITETRDILIWRFNKSFPFTDIQQIEFEITASRGKDETNYYANAIIVTKTDRLAAETLPARREEEVRVIADQLAELIGVPVVDKGSD